MLSIRTNLLLHYTYLLESNQGTPDFIIIPLKKELLEDLTAFSIEAIFDEKTGVQVKTKNGQQSRYIVTLIQKPSNLTALFYKTFQEWYNCFPNDQIFDPILNSQFEYSLDSSFAISYKSTYPNRNPQSLIHLPGLEESEILKIPVSTIKEVEAYFATQEIPDYEHHEEYPIRQEASLGIDLGFRQLAQQVIDEFPPQDTFYIVNTGHSFPVGALLLSSYQIPTSVFMRTRGLSTISIHRVLGQLTTFGEEIFTSQCTSTCTSFAWLLDCHCGETAAYDQRNGRGIINFTPNTYLNRMPKINELTNKNIQRVVVMLEYSPQLLIEVDDLQDSPYEYMFPYIKGLQSNGFEVVIKGIDPRSDISKAKDPS